MKPGSVERALLVSSCAVIVWLTSALVRVENQRYAMLVGLCVDHSSGFVDSTCLKKVETRTHWAWHLYYALTDQ